ncbi:hypothetical protein ACODNH_00265 (plasmid) [Haloarcula sp. NS06]|uniref:hypothetical protein n=1 Tax=Haloarcula sp. NS06 TaxID=3409688 RepID=UPI003DA7864C
MTLPSPCSGTPASRNWTAPTPLADVSPYGYECTVEGEVTHLIEEPDARNQYQVASTSKTTRARAAKVTVWGKSVHGGEMVRHAPRRRPGANLWGQARASTTA